MARRRFRVILYLLPALMDCITGIIFFIGPVRATLLGYDPLIAGSVVSSRSIACALTSVAVSRFLTPHIAVPMMFASSAAMVLICLSGMAATSLTVLYATSALSGAATVVFAASLQVFLKLVDSGERRPLSRVVGGYTASWCIGMAFGPFITGFLMGIGRGTEPDQPGYGWMFAYIAAALLSAAMFFGFAWVYRTSRSFLIDHRSRPHALEEGDPASRGKPDIAWLGWITAFIGAMVNGIVRGVFPAGATGAGMPEWRTGLIMTILSLAMGTFAFVVSRGNRWMYSVPVAAAFGIMGVAGLNLYAFPMFAGWEPLLHVWPYYCAALLFGCYSGTTYLYSAYHGLVHPERAGRNISLNETCIAFGMMLGPLLGGWLAREYGFFPPFVAGSVLVGGLATLQAVTHRRAARRS